jgi:hypothetical protein
MGSRESRNERIGKKYQWIALHELLARVADNFQMTSENGKPQQYASPAQLSIRDIDPTHVLKSTQDSHDANWWMPLEYDAWRLDINEKEWKSELTNDLPDPMKLIEVKDDTGHEWLALKGYYQWSQPIEIEDEARRYDLRRREVWYKIQGYLIHKKDAGIFQSWARKQDFWNNWMPESHEFYSVFFREFPHYEAFKSIDDPYYGRSGWVRPDRPRNGEESCPVDLMVVDDEYMQEGNAKDASVEDGFSIKLPCNYMYRGMNLSSSLTDGMYKAHDDSIVLMDPSVGQKGPGVLLGDKGKITEWMEQNDLTLVWTVLGEKMGLGGRREDRTGRLSVHGSFIMKGKRLNGGINTKYEE